MLTRFDIIYGLASPFILPVLYWRRMSKGKYRESTRGMMGKTLPEQAERVLFHNGSIWVHSVSVGETVAARPIITRLGSLGLNLPIVSTTITETGQAHAREILASHADYIHYFPLDFSWNVRRFQSCFNPKVFIMMETEIWPNFLSLAARRGTKVFMINGKLSEKSFRSYRKVRGFLRPAFDAIRAFCMQTPADAGRMVELCGRPDDVYVTGNCKFDTVSPKLSPEEVEFLRDKYKLGPHRPTVVVGSTHPGEEEVILEAFLQARKTVPDLQMILSPRHPERFRDVIEMCCQHEAKWVVSRATNPGCENPDVFILDTMGELARCYGLGDVAVVAGSFGNVGGHNLLEPAAHSIPVVVGPNMSAQKEIDRLFQGDDTGCVRSTAVSLGDDLADLFRDASKRSRLGEQALATALKNRGSSQASLDIVKKYLRP